MATYQMVFLGGKARMTRPSSTPLPLPAVRLNRNKLTTRPLVRDMSVTAIARVRPTEWKPGMVLARAIPALVFP